MKAVDLVTKSSFNSAAINWVAHQGNIDDFPCMIDVCQKYEIPKIMALATKPDADFGLAGAPDAEQFNGLANHIRHFQSISKQTGVEVRVESCYSPMRAFLGKRAFGNTNTGREKGCGAARDGISVDVEGRFTPCRHIEIPERIESIQEYWRESPALRQLRCVEDASEEPCVTCKFSRNCLSCSAIAVKMFGRICQANPFCPIGAA